MAPCADLLPEPLPSWSYGATGSEGGNGAGASGVPGAVLQSLCSAEYQRGDAIVYVRIFEGAPEGPPPFQGFLNPMTIAARGGSRERVHDREGVLVYEAATRRGELSVAIPPRTMAVVEGRNVAAEEIRRYAERIRYELIGAPD